MFWAILKMLAVLGLLRANILIEEHPESLEQCFDLILENIRCVFKNADYAFNRQAVIVFIDGKSYSSCNMGTLNAIGIVFDISDGYTINKSIYRASQAHIQNISSQLIRDKT